MITLNRNVLLVDLDALLAAHTTTAQLATTQASTPEEESAPTAPTPATLVTLQAPAPAASADSTSSKASAKPAAPLELSLSTESANAHQESFPTVSVLPAAAQASQQSMVLANLATLTAPNAQEPSAHVPPAFQAQSLTQIPPDVSQKLNAPTAKISAVAFV